MSNVKSLPEEERPRERLSRHGPESLSTIELIAIILGSGTKGKSVLHLAQEVLTSFPSLTDVSVEELCQLKGMGRTKAIQLKAALSLGARAAQSSSKPKQSLHSPRQAYLLVKDSLQNEKKENFVVILQDAKGKAILWEKISLGTLTHTLVHPREVFCPAIRHRAASLILAHNHPSGDPTPSPQDYQVTRLLVSAGHVVGIPVHDHLIIGSSGFVSLREEGFGF